MNDGALGAHESFSTRHPFAVLPVGVNKSAERLSSCPSRKSGSLQLVVLSLALQSQYDQPFASNEEHKGTDT